MDYVIKHNLEVYPSIVEVCPNSVDVIGKSEDVETIKTIREKYRVPQDKKVFSLWCKYRKVIGDSIAM